jgi:hypothetical protein
MNLSKLKEILTEECFKAESDSAEIFHDKLKSLGAKRLLIPLTDNKYQSDEAEAETLERMAIFSQQNPRCVLHYHCYDKDNHEVYAIPVDIAKKIIVLGGIP